MVQYRRLRETHDSGYCLNGLPSAQQIPVDIKLIVITTYIPIFGILYTSMRTRTYMEVLDVLVS